MKRHHKRIQRIGFAIAAIVAVVGFSSSSRAGSHLWVINEVLSNEDGTVQFVEMHVPTNAANEYFMNNKWVRSTTTGHQFTFTANLPAGSTAFAYLLLATEDFAALPGAPTPDYIVPDGFFDLDHDTIRWWSYGTGDLVFTSGQLPLDGFTSYSRDGSTGINTPTNFAGETGTINLDPLAVPPGGTLEAGFFLRVLMPEAVGASIGLEFQVPHPAPATVTLFDASGRLQRRVFDGTAAGLVQLRWDGHDDGGRSVPNGVYLFRLESGGRQAVRKIAYIR